jgi:hypothetical protein
MQRSFGGWLTIIAQKVRWIWWFYLGPLMSLPLLLLAWQSKQRWPHRLQIACILLLPTLAVCLFFGHSSVAQLAFLCVCGIEAGLVGYLMTDRWLRIALGICGMLMCGLFAETWLAWPHYAAPATCLFMVMALYAMNTIRKWQWQGEPCGLFIVRTLPLLALVVLVGRMLAQPLGWRINSQGIDLNIVDHDDWSAARGRALHILYGVPGGHLVIVQYGPHHPVDHEWVYNRADIDHARVVWAHDLGENGNRELIDYFKNRKVWLLTADTSPIKLQQLASPDGMSAPYLSAETPESQKPAVISKTKTRLPSHKRGSPPVLKHVNQ